MPSERGSEHHTNINRDSRQQLTPAGTGAAANHAAAPCGHRGHQHCGPCTWDGWETAPLPPHRHLTSRQGAGSNRNSQPRAAAAGGCWALLIASAMLQHSQAVRAQVRWTPGCVQPDRPCQHGVGLLQAHRAAHHPPAASCAPIWAVAAARAQLHCCRLAAATWGACAAGARATAMSHQAAARSAAGWRLHPQQMTQHCLGSPGLYSSSSSSCSLHSHHSSRSVLSVRQWQTKAQGTQCTVGATVGAVLQQQQRAGVPLHTRSHPSWPPLTLGCIPALCAGCCPRRASHAS